MEPGRSGRDGAAAVPRIVPVLRGGGQALLPTLPAQCRHFPRRAVQHCVVRPVDDDGGAGVRAGARRIRVDRGDCHLYLNHLAQAREQLQRGPRTLPRMHINPAVHDIFAFKFEDFTLEGYDPHPHIKAPVAV